MTILEKELLILQEEENERLKTEEIQKLDKLKKFEICKNENFDIDFAEIVQGADEITFTENCRKLNYLLDKMSDTIAEKRLNRGGING